MFKLKSSEDLLISRCFLVKMLCLRVEFVVLLSASVVCQAFSSDFQGHRTDSLQVSHAERGREGVDAQSSRRRERSSNGSREVLTVQAPPRYEAISENIPSHHEFLKYKRKSIVGSDDRIRVQPVTTQVLPFKAVVKVKMSARDACSGVLIGPRHVLSAAHCFHNGNRFSGSKRALNIGVLQRNQRFTWYRVKDVFLPRAWYDTRRMNPEFDYAVLTLRRPHGRPFLHMKAFSMKNLLPFGSMHFACFPNDKRVNSMWYSSCPVGWQPNGTSYRTVIMNKCDAAGGCSGAGVYVHTRSAKNRYVIGVLSSTVNSKAKNVVTRLTPKKVKEICGWIGWLEKSGCRKSGT